MGRAPANEAAIRRYLLGVAPDEEMEQTEQRLLTDREYFQEFLRLEEELIDEYVRGALGEHDRERFENYFVKAPERRESVEFAKALRRYVSQESVPKPASARGRERAGWRHLAFLSPQAGSRVAAAALVCAMLLLAAGATWLFAERNRLREEVEQLQSEQEKAARSEEELKEQISRQEAFGDELLQRLNQAQAQLDEKEEMIARLRESKDPNQLDAGAGLISLLLVPELRRGEDEPSVVYLAKNGGRLRLKMEVDVAGYNRYRAEVLTAEGAEIMRGGNLKAKVSRGTTVVEVEIAADRFPQGDYLVSLSGAAGGEYEKIATYHFRVVRRQPTKPQ